MIKNFFKPIETISDIKRKDLIFFKDYKVRKMEIGNNDISNLILTKSFLNDEEYYNLMKIDKDFPRCLWKQLIIQLEKELLRAGFYLGKIENQIKPDSLYRSETAHYLYRKHDRADLWNPSGKKKYLTTYSKDNILRSIIVNDNNVICQIITAIDPSFSSGDICLTFYNVKELDNEKYSMIKKDHDKIYSPFSYYRNPVKRKESPEKLFE